MATCWAWQNHCTHELIVVMTTRIRPTQGKSAKPQVWQWKGLLRPHSQLRSYWQPMPIWGRRVNFFQGWGPKKLPVLQQTVLYPCTYRQQALNRLSAFPITAHDARTGKALARRGGKENLYMHMYEKSVSNTKCNKKKAVNMEGPPCCEKVHRWRK